MKTSERFDQKIIEKISDYGCVKYYLTFQLDLSELSVDRFLEIDLFLMKQHFCYIREFNKETGLLRMWIPRFNDDWIPPEDFAIKYKEKGIKKLKKLPIDVMEKTVEKIYEKFPECKI